MASPWENARIPILSIGAVSRMTRLSPRQIRYYEACGLIRPARSKGKRRLYSKLDVERLVCVRELLNEGLALTTIREMIRDVREGGEERRIYWERLLPARLPRELRLASTAPVDSGAEFMRRLAAYEQALESGREGP